MLRDFLKIARTLSVFELEKCSLHKNGVEFHQKDNGTIYRKAIRQQPSQSATRNQTLPFCVKCQARAQCAPSPPTWPRSDYSLLAQS